MITEEGAWTFEEPNIYEIPERGERIEVSKDSDCWILEGYSREPHLIACECMLRVTPK